MPQSFVVPCSLSDSQILKASKCFMGNRPPFWSWGNHNECVIVRMASLYSFVTDTWVKSWKFHWRRSLRLDFCCWFHWRCYIHLFAGSRRVLCWSMCVSHTVTCASHSFSSGTSRWPLWLRSRRVGASFAIHAAVPLMIFKSSGSKTASFGRCSAAPGGHTMSRSVLG